MEKLEKIEGPSTVTTFSSRSVAARRELEAPVPKPPSDPSNPFADLLNEQAAASSRSGGKVQERTQGHQDGENAFGHSFNSIDHDAQSVESFGLLSALSHVQSPQPSEGKGPTGSIGIMSPTNFPDEPHSAQVNLIQEPAQARPSEVNTVIGSISQPTHGTDEAQQAAVSHEGSGAQTLNLERNLSPNSMGAAPASSTSAFDTVPSTDVTAHAHDPALDIVRLPSFDIDENQEIQPQTEITPLEPAHREPSMDNITRNLLPDAIASPIQKPVAQFPSQHQPPGETQHTAFRAGFIAEPAHAKEESLKPNGLHPKPNGISTGDVIVQNVGSGGLNTKPPTPKPQSSKPLPAPITTTGTPLAHPTPEPAVLSTLSSPNHQNVKNPVAVSPAMSTVSSNGGFRKHNSSFRGSMGYQLMNQLLAAEGHWSTAELTASQKAWLLYPHQLADPIRQGDIVDDGEPPQPRVEGSENVVEMMIKIEDLVNFPDPKEPDKAPFLMIEVSVNGETFHTPLCQGVDNKCNLNAVFNVRIPTHEVYHAKLECTLYDCCRFARGDVIGTNSILLKEPDEALQNGREIKVDFKNRDKELIHGSNGHPTNATFYFETKAPETESKDVISILNNAEGKLKLQWPGQRIDSHKTFGTLSSHCFVPAEMRLRQRRTDAEFDIPQAKKDEEQIVEVGSYWREDLEHVMDSLYVQFLIIVLVLIDVTTIVVYNFILSSDSDGDSPSTQLGLNTAVVMCFLIEIVLRVMAMGNRFFKSIHNVGDFVVVLASVAIVVVKFVVGTTSSTQGLQSIVVLRIISRVAVMLRVLRVLSNLRRARRFSGAVKQNMRSAVSQNKRRYRKHGFDLDLNYVTNRVMAMAAPAFERHSAYRNDIHVVASFLSHMHYGTFLVFNLCDTFWSSDGFFGNYHSHMLFNHVQRIPFEKDGAPLLVEILQMCQEGAKWLKHNPRNVVAVHCKGGKGRTGLMVSAFLLWSGHRRSAIDALELYTFRRTQDYDPTLGINGSRAISWFGSSRANQTVDSPSQVRYLHYLEAMLYTGINVLANSKMVLATLRIPVGPIQAVNAWYISFEIKCMRAVVMRSQHSDDQCLLVGGQKSGEVVFNLDAVIWGDVRIDIYRHSNRQFSSSRKLAMYVCFNTSFYHDATQIRFKKSKIDGIKFDRQHKLVDASFYIQLDVAIEPRDIMTYEDEFKNLAKKYGKTKQLRCGDEVMKQRNKDQKLVIVKSGIIEGYIEEDVNRHPLGCTVDQLVSGDQASCVRIPTVCIRGSDAVIGGGQVFLQLPNMAYRVRSQHAEIVEMQKEAAVRRQNTTMRDFVLTDRIEDMNISGMKDPAELSMFYQGLSINLASYLSRVRQEATRIGCLRSLTDEQAILQDTNEETKLAIEAIRHFRLPMNEKLGFIIKCVGQSGVKNQRSTMMRLLFFDNYLILDPAFFGPELSPASEAIRLGKFYTVSPVGPSKPFSLNLQLCEISCDDEKNFKKPVPVTAEMEFSFENQATCYEAYNQMSVMCSKAQRIRTHQRMSPFAKQSMKYLFSNAATEHDLQKGECIPNMSRHCSLYLVRMGEICLLTREGEVMRSVCYGECFGQEFFALSITSDVDRAVANTHSVVLQLQRDILEETIKDDVEATARFFHSLCQVIEKDSNDVLQGTFPGTWNKVMSDKEVFSAAQAATKSSNSASGPGGVGNNAINRLRSGI